MFGLKELILFACAKIGDEIIKDEYREHLIRKHGEENLPPEYVEPDNSKSAWPGFLFVVFSTILMILFMVGLGGGFR